MNETKKLLVGFSIFLTFVILLVIGGIAVYDSFTEKVPDREEYIPPDDEAIEFIDEAFTVFGLGNTKCQGTQSKEIISLAEMYLDNVKLVYMLAHYDEKIDQFIRDDRFGNDKQIVRDAVMVSDLGNELRSCLSAAEKRYDW